MTKLNFTLHIHEIRDDAKWEQPSSFEFRSMLAAVTYMVYEGAGFQCCTASSDRCTVAGATLKTSSFVVPTDERRKIGNTGILGKKRRQMFHAKRSGCL
jgi:hypothetical protein